MKTLNRPMFRYGGPIKEGIMNGIHEPRQNYKEAGVVDKNKNMYTSSNPKPGNTQEYRNFLEKKMYPDNLVGGLSRATGMMGDAAFNYGVKPLANLAQYILPLSSTPVKSKDYVEDNIDSILKSKGFMAPTLSEKINDTIPKTPEEIEAAKVASALKAEQAGVAKAEFAETEKQKRIDNYRKIMDIEGMSKDAAYDSLIDASRAVLDNPGTLKEGLKDGTLMSKIIGTTSKRFDKPKDTKDAINTLILKNQMAADTPSTALKDLIAIGIDTPEKQEAYLRTKLGQPSSLSAAEAIVAKSSAATGPSAIAYKAAEMMFGNEFKGNLMDEDSFTESFDEATKMFGKDKRPNEITVGIISQEAKKKGFPPGKYTVGNVVIDLDEEFNVKIIRE